MRLRVLMDLVEQLTGGESQQDLVSRVEALEAGGGGDSPALGANRVLGELFALPDATKDYYVIYNWDSPSNGNWEVILYHGIPDGAGWFTVPILADMLEATATTGQHLEVKGKIPAGHSVMMLVNSGSGGVIAVGIEVPIAA